MRAFWRRSRPVDVPHLRMRQHETVRSEDDQLLDWLKGLPEGEAKLIRSDAGWTQAEIAEHCGLTSGGSQVGRWERSGTGWSRVSGVRYARLLRELEVMRDREPSTESEALT